MRVPAPTPENLGRLFVERASAGDLEDVVALYEPNAVLALPGSELAQGAQEIRASYNRLFDARSASAPCCNTPR